MKENPGVKVSVTPVGWGQAVAKLQTAIAGKTTPDVSQMGTDMMGQFGATGAFEPVPASFERLLRERVEYEHGRRRRLGRAVVCRDRLLYYQSGHRREGGTPHRPQRPGTT